MPATHEGSKYHRAVPSLDGSASVVTDVYGLLTAYSVTCPGCQQAVKKLLCAGLRGKGDRLADLKGALAAVTRAVQLEENRVRGESPPRPGKDLVIGTVCYKDAIDPSDTVAIPVPGKAKRKREPEPERDRKPKAKSPPDLVAEPAPTF